MLIKAEKTSCLPKFCWFAISVARLKICKTTKNLSKTIQLVTFLVGNLANQSTVGAQANGSLYMDHVRQNEIL